jgi:site-specific recombinase XerD
MRKCNIRIVQQLLGHSSLQATQIYTHPSSRDLQTAINALNEQQY